MARTTVGVIGAGTMGTGIALALADAGYPVSVVDTDSGARARSRESIANNYAAQRRKGRLDEAQTQVREARIVHSATLDSIADCAVVVEAVVESLAAKQAVFAQLSAICDRAAIFATNTSTLDVDAIAGAALYPTRCIGMHFFSPAHIMKLVEVVRGEQTSEATVDTVCALARELGKTPVVVNNADGFVGNRMLLGYRREAEFLVLGGAEPRAVDAALEEFGFAMGPFAVSDLAGIDIGVRAKQERAARGNAPAFALTELTDKLVEAGRYGRKSGQGYYRYTGFRETSDDSTFAAIVAAERTRLKVAVRTITPAEIIERCVFALVNEGYRILDAGIATSASDIDTIWRLGYGFPAAQGGPMHYAATVGLPEVIARMRSFAQTDPLFWHIAPGLQREAGAQSGRSGAGLRE